MTKRNHLQSNPSNYMEEMREEKRKDMDIYLCFQAYAIWKTTYAWGCLSICKGKNHMNYYHLCQSWQPDKIMVTTL